MRRRGAEGINLEFRHIPWRQLSQQVVDGDGDKNTALGVADEYYFGDVGVDEDSFNMGAGQTNAEIMI